MKLENSIVGVDAGSLSIKIAYRENGYVKHFRSEHRGEPSAAFAELINANGIKINPDYAVITGKYADLISGAYNIPVISPIYCIVKTFDKQQFPDVKYFIDIGSSGLSVIELQDGKFHRYDTNSLCAAGTGAFLDQQMKRIGLNYDALQNISIIENPPGVASRCAVFAKSDLIHHQQKGYSIEQMWNGLVKGLAESAFTTLFRGKIINNDVFLVGGLANNKIFLHFFQKLLNNRNLRVAANPDFYLSNSLLNYLNNYNKLDKIKVLNKEPYKASFELPLSFNKSSEKKHIHYLDPLNNEVDIWNLNNGTTYEVFAGIDIGSTSTKIALLNNDGKVLFGLYTRTQGKPISALKNLFEGINILSNNRKVIFNIKGIGTTGSGRNLVGKFIGADIVKNEITAHLKGAIKEFPDVKTIIEIGGQDSKYIFVEDGWMKDANMNYVCAAGTGSFLEEQAKNLNIALDDIPAHCMDANPPISSDRCTVFMEQDAIQLLTYGYKRNEVMASILYSVCKNYLNRVVQNRPIEEPILFLGATAKNQGLVEAFENISNKKINTSQYSHLMGAIGIAEILRTNPPENSRFKGFEIRNKEAVLTSDNCELCTNKCLITTMRIEDENTESSWGYMCGKEPEESVVKKNNHLDGYKFISKVINANNFSKDNSINAYFPKALQYFSCHPFWRYFFGELKINLIPTPDTNEEIIALAKTYAMSDFCYPLKLAVGHAMYSINRNNLPVIIPFHIQDTANPKALNSFYCPLSQAFPAILKSALSFNNIDTENIISPVIDFSKPVEYNIKQLEQSVGKYFGISGRKIKQAYNQAIKMEAKIKNDFRNFGKSFIEKRNTGRPRFVILGRGYNILDQAINFGLPSTIARYGYEVIPMELLPIKRESISDDYKDMYWSYGQKIVVASKYSKKIPDVFPIFTSNFSCGPDSFLLNTFEDILGNKPSLILELDEHGGDTGYMTRLEAFFDRVEHYYSSNKTQPSLEKQVEIKIQNSFTGKKVYIPPMHPIGSRLMSAALRSQGIESVPLIKEDIETFTKGSAFVRGSECMPATSTIGAFLHKISQENGQNNGNIALFMPCASGPCRFGLYARLHKRIMENNGINASIISPTFDDNYGDISGALRISLLKVMIVSDLIFKLGCRLRPYEKEKGSIDNILETSIQNLENVFEKKESITKALKQLNSELKKLSFHNEPKPLVGVVGEIYVRNSPFSNSYLVKRIEENGGEAWVAPLMEWLHYSSKMKPNKNLNDFVSNKFSAILEQQYFRIFNHLLSDRIEPPISEVMKIGKEFIPKEVEGEPILTIGRAIGFVGQGAKLIVNVSPFGCMPGSICSSIFKDVSNKYNIPIVSVFYDGETEFSDLIGTYIRNAT